MLPRSFGSPGPITISRGTKQRSPSVGTPVLRLRGPASGLGGQRRRPGTGHRGGRRERNRGALEQGVAWRRFLFLTVRNFSQLQTSRVSLVRPNGKRARRVNTLRISQSGASEIAKALQIGRASVYRVLEAGSADDDGCRSAEDKYGPR
jgi:hypothetical protein